MDSVDLKKICPKKYRYILVTANNFSKLEWTDPLKKKLLKIVKVLTKTLSQPQKENQTRTKPTMETNS